jgi:hypothetical protein
MKIIICILLIFLVYTSFGQKSDDKIKVRIVHSVEEGDKEADKKKSKKKAEEEDNEEEEEEAEERKISSYNMVLKLSPMDIPYGQYTLFSEFRISDNISIEAGLGATYFNVYKLLGGPIFQWGFIPYNFTGSSFQELALHDDTYEGDFVEDKYRTRDIGFVASLEPRFYNDEETFSGRYLALNVYTAYYRSTSTAYGKSIGESRMLLELLAKNGYQWNNKSVFHEIAVGIGATLDLSSAAYTYKLINSPDLQLGTVNYWRVTPNVAIMYRIGLGF